VLQIQHDRFYLNWRRRERAYPTFSGIPERGIRGLKDRALEEFGRFSEFCERELRTRPLPNRIELAKVDLMSEGPDWKAGENLARLVTWLRPMVEFSASGCPQVALRYYEPRSGGALAVSIECGAAGAGASQVGSQGQGRVLKVESRVTSDTQGSDARALQEALERANRELNDEVFAKLIPQGELERFRAPRGAK
jgi:hypothetical protein